MARCACCFRSMPPDGLAARILIHSPLEFARELERRQWRVLTADSGFAAVGVARRERPEAIVIDLVLGDHSALEVVDDLKHDGPGARIVVLTGSATVSSAVDAMKMGVHDYLEKPTTVGALVAAIQRPRQQSRDTPRPPSLAQSERAHIEHVLNECQGNVSEAARRLRMHRRSLQRKLRKNPT